MKLEDDYIRIELGPAFDNIKGSANFNELLRDKINRNDNSLYSRILQLIVDTTNENSSGTSTTNFEPSLVLNKDGIYTGPCGGCQFTPGHSGFVWQRVVNGQVVGAGCSPC